MVMWSSNLCFYLNTNKCNVLQCGEKNINCEYFVSIDDADEKLNNIKKDPGVTYDPKYNFK